MTREQTTYLRQRLAVVRENKPRYWRVPQLPKPKAVRDAEKAIKRAQRVVKAWDKKVEDRQKAITKAVDEDHNYCMRLILTGDWKSALAAVDKFEKTKFV